MPLSPRPLIGMLALVVLGCAGGGYSTAPAIPSPASLPPPEPLPTVYNGAATLGSPMISGGLAQSALAIYTLRVDLSTYQATLTLKENREATATDDLYLLPIDSFLRADSFEVTGVDRDADSLNIGWNFSHPFPAPADPTGTPNGSTNRADLGVAASLLYLTDVPAAAGHSYFTDRIAETAYILNADSYYSPAALLDTTGLTANTFPMQKVIDEEADNRNGVSNTGNVTGNFGTDGWTRSELGAGNNGWTGFDILHQGQSTRGTVEISLTALETAGFSLDVAVLAKYNDPRGGTTGAEKKANRLPPATPDTSRFAYRMPHGVWDVSSVAFDSQDVAFFDTTISGATLTFYTTDWDARATETTEIDLADDPDPTHVALGEAGLPDFAVCIPGVLGDATVISDWDPALDVLDDDSAFGGDAATDSGQPGDELCYSKLITESITTGQTPGLYTGMARATDVEIANILDPFFVLELDGTLAPLSSGNPMPIGYAAFQVNVASTNSQPTAVVALTSPDPLNSGSSASVSITAFADAESDPLTVSVDWGDGGGFVTIISGMPSPYANQTPTGPVMMNADLVPDNINMTVRVTDGISAPVDFPVPYTLGPNRPPQITGTPALSPSSVPTPATFNMVLGSATAVDPEGDTIGLYTVNNRNADAPTSGTFMFPYAPNPSTPIANPPNSSVQFTVYATDSLHPTTAGAAYPAINGTITTGGPSVGWVYTAAVTAPGSITLDDMYSVTVDPSGNAYGLGIIPNNAGGVDFGGGLRANAATLNVYLVKIDGATGNYMWDRVFLANSSGGRPYSVETDSAGNVYALLTWNGTLLLSALGGTAVDMVSGGLQDMGIIKFNSAGTYQGFARSNDAVSASSESHPSALISGNNQGIAARGLAIDKSTDAVFCGHSPTSVGVSSTTVGGITIALNGNREPIVARFNGPAFLANGTTPAVWVSNLVLSAGATVDQRVNGLAVCGAGGNVAVSGQYTGITDFGGGSSTYVGGQDVFLVQCNAASGAYVAGSQRVFGTPGADSAPGIAADATHIYLSGAWAGAAGDILDIGAPVPTIASLGTVEGYVACFTTTGVPVWSRGQLGSGTGDHCSGGVALTGTDVFVAGLFNTTSPGAEFGYGPKVAAGSTDWTVAKFDRTTGATTGWQQIWAPPASSFDSIYGITVHAGNPIFCGRSQTGTNLDFDPGPGVVTRPMNNTDWAVVKLNGINGEF